MGRIRILPQAVADRIAAGEVVERPAAVLRELLDNALDAGAKRIDVELAGGGAELVAVADDGVGMDADDAVLAFERHATSKIATGDDLGAVATLGFRGEALAAIAAVSRVELLTCATDGAQGVRVVVDRGRIASVTPVPRSRGTTVAVHDLFGGIPARRKFLRRPGTELEHCLHAAAAAALVRWEVGFRVREGDRELLSAPPAPDMTARIGAVLGSRGAAGLVRASDRCGAVSVDVWAGPTDAHRPARDGIRLFVNRRPVRDPLLLRAVLDAYRPRLPRGRFPVAVVHACLPPDEVDVNVHPAKAEVRFHRPADVRTVVLTALNRALGQPAAIPRLAPVSAAEAQACTGVGEQTTLPRFDAPARAGAGGWASTSASPRALAQYRNCYIVAEDGEGLLIVDQHVAHERLLYEQLLRQSEQGPLPRQRLLFPATVEVGPAGLEILERLEDAIRRAGFVAEPFGGACVLVREVPTVLGRDASPETLNDVLALLRAGDPAGAEALFQRLLATVACHAAVRKGMALTPERMDYLLRGLASCAAPTHCPHGRVIALRVDLQALDRRFDRVS